MEGSVGANARQIQRKLTVPEAEVASSGVIAERSSSAHFNLKNNTADDEELDVF